MVYVDDNFHYMDEEERYRLGEYASYEEAVAICRAIVDTFLKDHYKVDVSADELFSHYRSFGEDPFIRGPEPDKHFSAWTYARERSEEICKAQSSHARE